MNLHHINGQFIRHQHGVVYITNYLWVVHKLTVWSLVNSVPAVNGNSIASLVLRIDKE